MKNTTFFYSINCILKGRVSNDGYFVKIFSYDPILLVCECSSACHFPVEGRFPVEETVSGDFVTHKCLVILGLDYGLAPIRRQAII